MNARDYALVELDAKRLPGWTAPALRQRRIDRAQPPDPRDRALGEQIIAGVVKNLLLLQYWIESYAQRPLRKIDPLIQKILAVGLYQLRFLDRIPSPAAVDEAVEQCKRFKLPRAGGFVNAVLRRSLTQPAPTAPPHIALSYPKDLLDRLKSLLGEEDALRLAQAGNRQPPLIVRMYTNADPQHLLSTGVAVTPHTQPGLYILANARQPNLADLAQRGIAQVQDPTSAAVVTHLDIRPGQSILDRCAGLGTKTLQIQDLLQSTGQVFAIDPSPHRCDQLRQLLVTRHITNVGVVQSDRIAGLGKILPERFDRILVDAPCSNSGVFARRPEARYNQTPDAFQSLAQLQQFILDDTAPHLAPGGLLLYSTCSIWPEENQAQIARFLTTHPDFTQLEDSLTLPSLDPSPSHHHDGGYYSLLARNTSRPM